jgi:hypothetical protein
LRIASTRERGADHPGQIDLAIWLGEQEFAAPRMAIVDRGVLRIAGGNATPLSSSLFDKRAYVSIRSSPNSLLQALPEAKVEAPGQCLELVELVRETVQVEAGNPPTHVYLPHSGPVSMMVRLSGGRAVEVATIERDSVFGAAAALDGGQLLTSAVVVLPGARSCGFSGGGPSKRHFLNETTRECYGAVNAHHRRLLKISH